MPATEVTEDAVVEQALDWFHRVWDPDLSLLEWRQRFATSGWAVPSWSPDWFGKGLPSWADRAVHAAIRASGGVAGPLGVGMMLAAPTIYEHADDDLKRRLLEPTITGEFTWCQLFSEPGAGSDLAGLRATAVRDGDTWVVNGQKVWNTSADHADKGILVARTDWTVPKHAGLTYFALDMHQPGVETRPIRQMNEHQSFNEVFMTDARIPHGDVIGAVGDGWRVARATLAHERSFSVLRSASIAADAAGRVVDEARVEAAEYLKTYEWYPQRAGRVDLLAESAVSHGRAGDRVIRQQVVRATELQRASQWTADRATATREMGRPPGPEGSIGKLALSEVARRAHSAHTAIIGAQGMLRDGDHELDAVVAEVLVSTPAQSIAGGTDEIQKNILGENMLGLPREPAVDRGVPFQEVVKGPGHG